MTQQGDIEGGGAGRIGRQRARGSRGDPPARQGDAWFGIGRRPQQEAGNTGPFRRQHQPACRGQIEIAAPAPAFDDNHGKRRAAHRVDPRRKGVTDRLDAHKDQSIRFKPELGKPGGVQHAGFRLGKGLPHPKDRHGLAARAHGQPCHEARCRAKIARLRGEDFMQAIAGKPAIQGPVQVAIAEINGRTGWPGRAV